MNGDEVVLSEGSTPEEQLAKALPRLTPEQIAAVSPRLKRRAFEPGEAIIHQGDPPDNFYIVLQGQAEVLYEDLEGRSEVVDVRKQGDFFGETGLLQDRPRSATVRADADSGVELLSLSREDFQAMMDESKATEMHLVQEMIQRLIRLANVEALD